MMPGFIESFSPSNIEWKQISMIDPGKDRILPQILPLGERKDYLLSTTSDDDVTLLYESPPDNLTLDEENRVIIDQANKLEHIVDIEEGKPYYLSIKGCEEEPRCVVKFSHK